MMNKTALSILILVFAASLMSCSGRMDVLIPDILGENGEARLQKRLKKDEATALFNRDPNLLLILNEFMPLGVNAGTYDARGIMVNLGLARCAGADDAYGIYSGLTAGPRDRWRTPHGEMSYKSPYFAGCSGEYVFWFYSPSNPMSYFDFYKKHGEKILAEFVKIRKANNMSYHSRILPVENRYVDSMFYVKSRMVKNLLVTNAYAATYQIKMKEATMYVMKFESPEEAEKRTAEYVHILVNNNIIPVDFMPMPGSPTKAYYWDEKSGVSILCQYRWLVLYLANMSDNEYAKSFIQIMFRNMAKIRNEVMPKVK